MYYRQLHEGLLKTMFLPGPAHASSLPSGHPRSSPTKMLCHEFERRSTTLGFSPFSSCTSWREGGGYQQSQRPRIRRGREWGEGAVEQLQLCEERSHQLVRMLHSWHSCSCDFPAPPTSALRRSWPDQSSHKYVPMYVCTRLYTAPRRQTFSSETTADVNCK